MNLRGIFEGNNAGEGNVQPQIQSGFGKSGIFGEAVDNAGIGLSFFQNRQSIGGGIAGVDNHGQTAFVGGLDVFGEAAVLPCQIAFAPVIIQARFAYADDFRVFCRFNHFSDGKFFGFLAVGVNAYGAVNLFIGLGNVEDFGKTLFAYADGKRLLDALFFHVGEHFRQAVAQAFEIEVAVRIN